MLDQTLGPTQHRLFEILVPHTNAAQKLIYTLGITDRTECAANSHPIKTVYYPDDIFLVSLNDFTFALPGLSRGIYYS